MPWVVSGKSAPALAAQAARLLAHVGADERLDPADVGYSLARRSVFEHRAVVVGDDRRALMAGLAGLAQDNPGAGVVVGRAAPVGKTVLVFPGQGAQWVGMGAQLLDARHRCSPSRCAPVGEALAPFVDWSLLDVVRGVVGAPGLDRVDVVQPVLWAVMVSLARLWRVGGGGTGCGDRAFAGRDRRGVCGRGVVAGGCRAGGGGAQPVVGGVGRRRGDGVAGVWARIGRRS